MKQYGAFAVTSISALTPCPLHPSPRPSQPRDTGWSSMMGLQVHLVRLPPYTHPPDFFHPPFPPPLCSPETQGGVA